MAHEHTTHGVIQGLLLLALPRLLAVAAVLVAAPLGSVVPPLVALGLVVAVLAVLITFESIQYSSVRAQMRSV